MLEKIKIPLLVILGIVLVGVLARAFMGGKAPAPAAPTTPTAANAQPGAPAPKTSAPSAPAGAVTTEPVKLAISNVDVMALTEEIKQVQFVYETRLRNPDGQEHEKRNPMKSPIFAGPGLPGGPGTGVTEPTLSQTRVIAIVWDERFPVAIVRNEGALKTEDRQDRCIYVGCTYAENITVQSIERDKVVFKMNDAEIPIPLGSGASEPNVTINEVK